MWFLINYIVGADVSGALVSFCGLVVSVCFIIQDKLITILNAYWAGHVDDIIFKASKVRDDMVELIEENKKLRFILKQFEDDGK